MLIAVCVIGALLYYDIQVFKVVFNFGFPYHTWYFYLLPDALLVIALAITGIAGLSSASKLKRSGNSGTWCSIIGIACFIWGLLKLNLLVFGFYVLNYEMKHIISPELPTILMSMYYLAYILQPVAAALLFISAIKAKKALAQSTLIGTIAAVVLGIEQIGFPLYYFVIQPYLHSTAHWALTDNFFALEQITFPALLIIFAVCETIFFIRAAKKLRRG